MDLQAVSLHKDLHATMHAPPSLGLGVVDGARALSLKGGGLAGASQAVPTRILPGLRKPPQQGSTSFHLSASFSFECILLPEMLLEEGYVRNMSDLFRQMVFCHFCHD